MKRYCVKFNKKVFVLLGLSVCEFGAVCCSTVVVRRLITQSLKRTGYKGSRGRIWNFLLVRLSGDRCWSMMRTWINASRRYAKRIECNVKFMFQWL